MNIRLAQLSDLAAITEIYNEAIINTTATFDTEVKSLANRELWFQQHGKSHPIFVAEVNHQVIGFSSLSSWSDKLAYAESAEVSFYVDKNFQGKGIGRKLLEQLDQIAPIVGLHTLISRITSESTISIHLHETLGFRTIGVMEQIGKKFGKRLDVVLMQKIYSK